MRGDSVILSLTKFLMRSCECILHFIPALSEAAPPPRRGLCVSGVAMGTSERSPGAPSLSSTHCASRRDPFSAMGCWDLWCLTRMISWVRLGLARSRGRRCGRVVLYTPGWHRGESCDASFASLLPRARRKGVRTIRADRAHAVPTGRRTSQDTPGRRLGGAARVRAGPGDPFRGEGGGPCPISYP